MTPVNPLSAPSAPAAWASAARQDRLRAPGREGRAQTVTAPVTAEPANAGSLRDRHCVRCGYGVAVRTPPPACPMCGAGVFAPRNRQF